jgi:nitroreductase
MNVLELNIDEKPYIGQEKEKSCIKCGHCEAVCPNQAINLEGESLKGSPDIIKSFVSKEQIDYLIRSRRSIRNYKDEPVDKTTIEEIFDTVRYAPSGMNSQSVNWMILQNKEEMNKITDILIQWIKDTSSDTAIQTPFHHLMKLERTDPMGMVNSWERGVNPLFYNAPHLAITHAHKFAPTGSLDSMIALSYLDITLPAYNLGGCWAGFFQIIANSYPQLAEKIGIPKKHIITGGIMFGYPKAVYRNIPKRNDVSIIWSLPQTPS